MRNRKKPADFPELLDAATAIIVLVAIAWLTWNLVQENSRAIPEPVTIEIGR